MRKRKIDIALLRYLQGELPSKKALDEVESWIALNERNRAYFNQFNKLWEEKQFVEQLKTVDVERIRAGLQKKIEARQSPPSEIHIPLRSRLVWRVAALILVLLLPSATLYFLKTRSANPIRQVSATEMMTEIMLSDGSIIELNRASSLHYPEKLGKGKREVELSGEAFFQVASKVKAPFVVHVGNVEVEVLGTSFHIKEEEERINVHVLSGKVLLYESGMKRKALRLEKGSEAVYHIQSGSFEQGAFRSENFLFWKTSILTFRDDPLSAVFSELSIHFKIPIISDDQTILRDRLTTSCEGQHLEEILDELSFLHDLRFDHRNDTIYVLRRIP
jgi:ferric-dicitrate binding protein FerR (iron transport regulator)